jgi:mRNA interferase MazF
MSFPRRGEIYLVRFDPTVGHEIQKTRPALIIQNDVSNEYSPITIVAAITPQYADRPHPREVLIRPGKSGLNVISAVVLNQIRLIDRRRLVKRLGIFDTVVIGRVDRAIQISLGLIEI